MSQVLITRDGALDRKHYRKLLRRYYLRRFGRIVYKAADVTLTALDDFVQAGQPKK